MYVCPPIKISLFQRRRRLVSRIRAAISIPGWGAGAPHPPATKIFEKNYFFPKTFLTKYFGENQGSDPPTPKIFEKIIFPKKRFGQIFFEKNQGSDPPTPKIFQKIIFLKKVFGQIKKVKKVIQGHQRSNIDIILKRKVIANAIGKWPSSRSFKVIQGHQRSKIDIILKRKVIANAIGKWPSSRSFKVIQGHQRSKIDIILKWKVIANAIGIWPLSRSLEVIQGHQTLKSIFVRISTTKLVGGVFRVGGRVICGCASCSKPTFRGGLLAADRRRFWSIFEHGTLSRATYSSLVNHSG